MLDQRSSLLDVVRRLKPTFLDTVLIQEQNLWQPTDDPKYVVYAMEQYRLHPFEQQNGEWNHD
jgi:hypothetical protein